jgi:DHA2 family multidrug resistance protein
LLRLLVIPNRTRAKQFMLPKPRDGSQISDAIPAKWGVTATITCGMLVVGPPFYAMYVALPKIMVSFSADVEQVQWVISAFAIAEAVMMPTVGWLGSVLGYRRLYMSALSAYMLFALLSALAWNIESLIAFRILQGLAEGPLQPVSVALFYRSFPPPQRGLAVGLYILAWALCAILAYSSGGYLIEHLSWRLVFLVTLPLGLPSLMLAMGFLPAGGDGQRRSLDGWGLTAMVCFLVPLLLALNRGPRYGWDATFTLVCMAIAAPALLAFVALELMRREPFVDLRLFKNVPFSMASIVRFLHSTGLHTYAFLVALFVQQTLGYTPLQAGLMMLPGAVVMGGAGLLVGRLADKIEPRAIVVVGLTSLALVGYALSFVSPLTTVAWLILLLVWLRMSTECIFSPLNVAALRTLPEAHVGMGSGVLHVIMGIGAAVGTAGTASLLSRWESHHSLTAAHEGNPLSLDGRAIVSGVEEVLRGAGAVEAQLGAEVDAALQAYARAEASIAAFQDMFMLIALLYAVTIIPALLITPPRQPKGRK